MLRSLAEGPCAPTSTQQGEPTLKDYDRVYGELHQLALFSRPTTIKEAMPLAGNVTTFIVQTAYHNDATVVFLEALDAEETYRLVLPSKVVSAIVRQDKSVRDRATDRRSEARRKADSEREKIAAARKLLERKREERRAKRASA